MTLNQLKKDLCKYATRKRATNFSRFFKTGKDEYGEGDRFLGISTPNSRSLAKKYKYLSLAEIQKLIRSEIHEERFIALLILIEQFKKVNQKDKEDIFKFYIKNTKYINNWDLVDISAHKIVGEYLLENPYCVTIFKGQALKGSKLLNHLAESKNLWERRIAIVSTAAFIIKGKFGETLEIAEILLNDRHDLIHKAVGWMLREVGKRSLETEEKFLEKHYKKMPRTMLRYAIEKFSENKRQYYLKLNNYQYRK